MKKAIVIGGGLGGLATAIRLAAEGCQVTLLEKNERVGGKLNIRSGSGYTFDTGPSILTMPWVLDSLFASANKNRADYMEFIRIEPQWRTFFEDGTTVDLTSDLPKLMRQLESISPVAATEFFSYLSYSKKMYDTCLKSFYNESISGVNDLRKLHTLEELMSLDPMRTVAQASAKHFSHPHLQQLFNFLVMYVGASPYQAPAVLSQLAYVQLGLGIYYVKGGMYNIARGMSRLLEELGVHVKTNTEVEEIVTKGSQVTAVKTTEGEIFEADVIVSNLEAIPSYTMLFKGKGASRAKKALKQLKKFNPSVSGHVMLLGMDRAYDHLAHHNFFFSKNPEKEFSQMFTDRIPADDPTIYIGVSAKTDASQAPSGTDNLFVLTHVPPMAMDEDQWTTDAEHYRHVIMHKLNRMGLPLHSDNIVWEHQFTPTDLKQLYGANGGSIYGTVADKKVNGGFRVPNRSEVFDNLYLVGGSTHPGGGVPMATLSGLLTAELMIENHITPLRKARA
ncbi:phytoene desaturase family protein [Litoribacterium kuwaitense]|uniref:phytoene desaturase family protein n=1 Tax=Litoribacterium kuwaitense TaxID=1398745 RepID=UPI0028A6DF61|nr:phytoene desaturase family protein [Litoribacterium kuwaitense]